MNIDQLISAGGLLLGLLSMLAGFFLWYRGAIEKGYAAKRDFGHLRKGQEQLIVNLEALLRDGDKRFDSVDDELKEIKAATLALSQRFEVILFRLEANSGIYGQKSKGSE